MNQQTELSSVIQVLNEHGAAIGNEHETYSTAQRVKHVCDALDYFMRQVDIARAESFARGLREAAAMCGRAKVGFDDNGRTFHALDILQDELNEAALRK